ncbi:membrane protein [Klebsiella variicola]|nr:membrane protein [Klebsiella variicola]
MNALLQQWDMAVIMLQIVAIDLLLGGDNAVVIAMACRKLPPQKRTKAIIIGTVGAILARVLLLALALYLLSLPWLKIVGALLLLWIGMKLVSSMRKKRARVGSSASLWRTAITITVADVIMSLDNVLAVAAAGKGHIALVALGVAISIPIIVAGSKLVLVLLTRFPAVVLLGGMLIGWIAGSMLVSDPTIQQLFPAAGDGTARVAGAVGALLVLFEGWPPPPTAAGERVASPTDAADPDGVKFPPLFLPLQGALPYALY